MNVSPGDRVRRVHTDRKGTVKLTDGAYAGVQWEGGGETWVHSAFLMPGTSFPKYDPPEIEADGIGSRKVGKMERTTDGIYRWFPAGVYSVEEACLSS